MKQASKSRSQKERLAKQLQSREENTDQSKKGKPEKIHKQDLSTFVPSQILRSSGHLPSSSSQYLDQISQYVPIDKILKVHQIFPFISSKGLDYSVVCLKINCPQIQQFYGGYKYLVQVWQNKSRLYQHLHNYPILTISQNDDILAYLVDIPAEERVSVEVENDEEQNPDQDLEQSIPYDTNHDFIFIVKPFENSFVRVEYPFSNDQFNLMDQKGQLTERVLFVNHQYLIVAQGNKIKYCSTDEFFKPSQSQMIKFFMCRQQALSNIKIYSDAVNNKSKNEKTLNRKGQNQNWLLNGLNNNESQDEELDLRIKTMQNSQPFYKELVIYSNHGQVGLVNFIDVYIGFNWKVLFVDHDQFNTNKIFVYTSQSRNLILQVYELNTQEEIDKNVAINTDNYDSDDQQQTQGVQRLKEVKCWKGAKTAGDEYIFLRVTQINKQCSITTLLTIDGHLDISMSNLLIDSDSTFQEPYRVSTKEQLISRGYRIRNCVITKEFLYIEQNLQSVGQQKSDEEKDLPFSQVYQYKLNLETTKINYNSRRLFNTLPNALLSEKWLKDQLRMFNDIKVLGGMVVLAHGVILSFYLISSDCWYHFFNKRDINRANKYTAEMIQTNQTQNDYISEELSEIVGSDSNISDSYGEDHSKEGIAFREFCHFNCTDCEILKVEFLPIQQWGLYEVILVTQEGLLRKVKFIQKTIERQHSSKFAEQELNFDKSEEGREDSQKMTIVCENVGCVQNQRHYFAKVLYSQVDKNQYSTKGDFKINLFAEIIDFDRNNQISELYILNKEGQMEKLFALAPNIRTLQVQNVAFNKLFMLDGFKNTLYIFNLDRIKAQAEKNVIESKPPLQIEQMIREMTYSHIIEDFNCDSSTQYQMDEDHESLWFTRDGDLVELDLQTSKQKVHDFHQSIKHNSFLLVPSKQVYYLSVKGVFEFYNFDWAISSANHLTQMEKEMEFQQQSVWRFISQAESEVDNIILYDFLNEDIAITISTDQMKVIPNLSRSERTCRNSFKINQNIIAFNIDRSFLFSRNNNSEFNDHLNFKDLHSIEDYNRLEKYACPSEYVAKFCALDGERNSVFVWEVGTGKQVREIKNLDNDYTGFKMHSEWHDCTLLLKRNDDRSQRKRSHSIGKKNTLTKIELNDVWRKVRVGENGVILQKEFYHQHKPDSVVYLSSQNDIVLEFTEDWIHMYHIRKDLNTEFIDEVRRENQMMINIPLYFAPDFKRYLSFEPDKMLQEKTILKRGFQIKVYQTRHQFDSSTKTKQYMKYLPLNKIYLPNFDDLKTNFHGLPYIYFSSSSSSSITYLNKCMIEQTTILADSQYLVNSQKLLKERVISPDMRFIMQNLSRLETQSGNRVGNLSMMERLMVKSQLTLEFNQQLMTIITNIGKDPQSTNYFATIKQLEESNSISSNELLVSDQTSVFQGSTKLMQTFSLNTWRVIEMIADNQISIDTIQPQNLKEIMMVVLPDGSSLLSILVNSLNFQQIEILSRVLFRLKQDPSAIQIPFRLVPDIFGCTALHECTSNNYVKPAETIIRLLALNPQGDHINSIIDIIPGLIQSCPLAMKDYFDKRLIDCDWSLKHTKGNLKKPSESLDFGVFSSPLIALDNKLLEQQLFQQNNVGDQNEKKQKRLPLAIRVFDMPQMHHFNNSQGQQLIKVIAETDCSELFDQKFIQALIEYQWPAVRTVIIKDLFVPYMMLMTFFSFYSLSLFDQNLHGQLNGSQKALMIVTKLVIILISLYFLHWEFKELRQEKEMYKYFSNPWNYIDILPIISIFAVLTLSMFNKQEKSHLIETERYLMAFASFLIWIKVLYFLRIFRSIGHLIKIIFKVFINIRNFLVMVLFAVIAFAGTFFILAQNNKNSSQDYLGKTYLKSVAAMGELMLGNVNTDKIGSSGYIFSYIIFMTAAIFLLVVMLNLLIAIISNTYDQVIGEARRGIYQEFALLICENYKLLSQEVKNNFDRKGNYLFVSEINQGSLVQVKELNNIVNLQSSLNRELSHVGSELSKKEIEEIIDRRVGQMERNIVSRLEEILKNR